MASDDHDKSNTACPQSVVQPTATSLFFLCVAHRGLPPPAVLFSRDTTLDWQAKVHVLDRLGRPVEGLQYTSALCSTKANAKNHACDQALEDFAMPNVLPPLAPDSLLNGPGTVCGECRTWRVRTTDVCHRLDLHRSQVTAAAKRPDTRLMMERLMDQRRLTRQALHDLQLQHVPAV
jgi:hypothetical protein